MHPTRGTCGDPTQEAVALTVFLLIFALLCGLLFLGFPVGFGLGISGLIGLILSDQPVAIIAKVLYSSVDNFVLLAIPLFVLMSRILMRAGMGDGIFDALNTFLRHLPGGLAVAAVICCAFFATISGSSVTNAAAIGIIAIPALVQHGYPKEFAAGLVAAGGTLGILIPPSIPFVVYGAIADQSVDKLFIAGVVPGVLLTLLIAGYAMLASWLRGYGTSEPRASWHERWTALRKSWGVLLLPVLILGGIYSGIFTPTEAAAVGFAITLFLATVVYRRLNFQEFWKCVIDSVHITVMILVIIGGANVFAHVSTTMQVPQALADALVHVGLNRLVFLVLASIALIIVGDFLDPLAAILVFVPLLLPSLAALQIDPIWFGVVLVINMELANITPPVGLNLFVIQAIEPSITYAEVFRGTVPFMVVIFLLLAIVLLFPQLALWLPGRL
jgi:C4-dicarboxylate transporter, DctM subunit